MLDTDQYNSLSRGSSWVRERGVRCLDFCVKVMDLDLQQRIVCQANTKYMRT